MRKLRVLYDYKVFQHQQYGGVSRYFVGLMMNMKRTLFLLPIIFSENKYLEEVSDIRTKKFPTILPFGRITVGMYINKIYFLLSLLFGRHYDVFHPTETDGCFFTLQHKPSVITIHDMIFELMPDDGFPNCSKSYVRKTIQNKKKLIERADHIIAVSKNTKKDILKIYPQIPENKITVVYHACVLETISQEEIISPLVEYKYILYVGGREGYKNFQKMLKAIASLLIEYADIKLVCTGAPFTEEEIILFKTLNVQDSIVHFFASDNDMGRLYANAQLFIYPSVYEGFGFPLLEAFHYGVPVCIANSSCFPEIAEDAAVYFDPYNEVDIRNSVVKMLTTCGLREKMVNKGRERLKCFSLDRMIKETESIYKSVTKNV